MNNIQQIISNYYALTKEQLAKEVFNFHIEMELKCGCKVKGHITSETWGIEDTAHSFNMSKGMVAQLLHRHKAVINGERSKY